jgi:outer membrane immunogenic protein
MRRVGPGLVVVLALSAGGVCAPARAADIAVPQAAPPTAYLPPARYDWTGIYAGGSVGAGLLDDTIDPISGGATPLSTGVSMSPVGFIAGAQVGANFQFSSLVLGAEASWTDSVISGSTSGVNATGGGIQIRMTDAPQWFAAVTGRVGYALNDILLYAKAGGAMMSVNYTQDQLTAGVTTTTQILSDKRSAFTAGLGVEYGMTENLSARLEYDYYGFGSRNYQFSQAPVSLQSDLNTITLGFNYRFNWANTPSERCPTC